MTKSDLADIYRDYIACLNRQDWPALGQFVHDDVAHNARPFGLSGYRAMLEQDFRADSGSAFQHRAAGLRSAPHCVPAEVRLRAGPESF